MLPLVRLTDKNHWKAAIIHQMELNQWRSKMEPLNLKANSSFGWYIYREKAFTQ